MKASEYRKLASAKRAEATIFDVTTPSGSVWKMLEPPIQQFVAAGKLPSSLAVKMAAVAAAEDKIDASKKFRNELTPEDLVNNLAFGRDLLIHCAVEPRISLNPKTEDEIAPEDILPEDFPYLISWVMTGGVSGESLGTFRSE